MFCVERDMECNLGAIPSNPAGISVRIDAVGSVVIKMKPVDTDAVEVTQYVTDFGQTLANIKPVIADVADTTNNKQADTTAGQSYVFEPTITFSPRSPTNNKAGLYPGKWCMTDNWLFIIWKAEKRISIYKNNVFNIDGRGTWSTTPSFSIESPIKQPWANNWNLLIDCTDNWAIVGDGYGDPGSKAYIYKNVGGVWRTNLPAFILDLYEEDYAFGASVAITDNYAAVGSTMKYSDEKSGKVYIFENNGGVWNKKAAFVLYIDFKNVKASRSDYGNSRGLYNQHQSLWGEYVALTDNWCAVGQRETAVDGSYKMKTATGTVSIFKNNGGIWESEPSFTLYPGVEPPEVCSSSNCPNEKRTCGGYVQCDFGGRLAMTDEWIIVPFPGVMYQNNGGVWDTTPTVNLLTDDNRYMSTAYASTAAISKSWAVIGHRRSGNQNAKVTVYKYRSPFSLSISQSVVQYYLYETIITHAVSSHPLKINDIITISGFIAGGTDLSYPGCVNTRANGNCGENRFRPMNQKFRVLQVLTPTTTKLTLKAHVSNPVLPSSRINMFAGTWNECDPVAGCVGAVIPGSPWGKLGNVVSGQFRGTWPEFTLIKNYNNYAFGSSVAVTDRTIMATSGTTDKIYAWQPAPASVPSLLKPSLSISVTQTLISSPTVAIITYYVSTAIPQSAETVLSGAGYHYKVAFDAATEGSFVMSWKDRDNNCHAVAGMLSGTLLTFGSETVIISSGLCGGNMALVNSGAGQYVSCYQHTNTNAYCRVLSVAGITITQGDISMIIGVNKDMCDISMIPGTSNFVATYQSTQSGEYEFGVARIGTISDASIITFGQAIMFNAGLTGFISSSIDATTSKLLVTYSDKSNNHYGTARVGTISGTSISFGTSVVYTTAAIGRQGCSIDPNTPGSVVVAYKMGGYGKFKVGVISGTTVSFGSEGIFLFTEANYIVAHFDPSQANRFAVLFTGNLYGVEQWMSPNVEQYVKFGTVSGTTAQFSGGCTFDRSRSIFPGSATELSIAFNPFVSGQFLTAFRPGHVSELRSGQTTVSAQSYIGRAMLGKICRFGVCSDEADTLVAGNVIKMSGYAAPEIMNQDFTVLEVLSTTSARIAGSGMTTGTEIFSCTKDCTGFVSAQVSLTVPRTSATETLETSITGVTIENSLNTKACNQYGCSIYALYSPTKSSRAFPCTPPDSYREQSDGLCHACMSSYATEKDNEDTCRCLAGTYDTGNGCASMAVTTCPPGEAFSSNSASSTSEHMMGSIVDDGSCSVCEAGKYKIETAPTKCKFCPAGKKFVSTTAECITCDAGKYQNQNNVVSASCQACLVGTYNVDDSQNEEEHDSISDCKFCASGTEFDSAITECNVCIGGTYQSENSAASASCQACTELNEDCPIPVCGAGTYLSDDKITCQACVGTYITDDGQNQAEHRSINDCKFCPVGKQFLSTTSECSICDYSKYQDQNDVANVLCKSCPSNSYITDDGNIQDAHNDVSDCKTWVTCNQVVEETEATDVPQCVAGINHLRDDPTSIQCGVNGCDVTECCEPNPTCADTDKIGTPFSSCNAVSSHIKSSLADITCAGGTCLTTDCCIKCLEGTYSVSADANECVQRTTCADASSCPAGHYLNPGQSSSFCSTSSCDTATISGKDFLTCCMPCASSCAVANHGLSTVAENVCDGTTTSDVTKCTASYLSYGCTLGSDDTLLDCSNGKLTTSTVHFSDIPSTVTSVDLSNNQLISWDVSSLGVATTSGGGGGGGGSGGSSTWSFTTTSATITEAQGVAVTQAAHMTWTFIINSNINIITSATPAQNVAVTQEGYITWTFIIHSKTTTTEVQGETVTQGATTVGTLSTALNGGSATTIVTVQSAIGQTFDMLANLVIGGTTISFTSDMTVSGLSSVTVADAVGTLVSALDAGTTTTTIAVTSAVGQTFGTDANLVIAGTTLTTINAAELTSIRSVTVSGATGTLTTALTGETGTTAIVTSAVGQVFNIASDLIVGGTTISSFDLFDAVSKKNLLSSVVYLNLAGNKLTTVPSVGSLATLKQLDLSRNTITSKTLVANTFASNIVLTDIDLSNNKISGTLSDVTFASNTALVSVKLNNNQITSFQTGAFSTIKKLEVLDVSENSLTSVGVTSLDFKDSNQWGTLLSLDIGNNQITTLEAEVFSGLASIQTISVQGNQVTSIDLDAFVGCTELTEIDLSGNQLESLKQGTFENLIHLKDVSLGGNVIDRNKLGKEVLGDDKVIVDGTITKAEEVVVDNDSGGCGGSTGGVTGGTGGDGTGDVSGGGDGSSGGSSSGGSSSGGISSGDGSSSGGTSSGGTSSGGTSNGGSVGSSGGTTSLYPNSTTLNSTASATGFEKEIMAAFGLESIIMVWVVVGCIAGSLQIICCLIFLCCCCRKKNNKKDPTKIAPLVPGNEPIVKDLLLLIVKKYLIKFTTIKMSKTCMKKEDIALMLENSASYMMVTAFDHETTKVNPEDVDELVKCFNQNSNGFYDIQECTEWFVEEVFKSFALKGSDHMLARLVVKTTLRKHAKDKRFACQEQEQAEKSQRSGRTIKRGDTTNIALGVQNISRVTSTAHKNKTHQRKSQASNRLQQRLDKRAGDNE